MHLKAGWYFEVEFHDVNKNGKVDILTTTWSRSEEFGQTIGYELNARDWKNPESWIKQTIYNLFPRFLNCMMLLNL